MATTLSEGDLRVKSESELIACAQSGDAEAFCHLARHYERKVYWLALHYCRDAQAAEDLSQEVWLKAFKSLTSFRGEASFYTWLRQIMIHTFLNDRRAATLENRGLRDESPEWESAAMAVHFDMEDRVHTKLLLESVRLALDEMTAQQRLIFLLKHREGMTYDEISAALGCSVGTVKKSLFRTIMKLRERLGATADQAAYSPLASGENC